MAQFKAVTPEGLKHFYDTYVDPKFVKVDGVSALTISAEKVTYGNSNVKTALDSLNTQVGNIASGLEWKASVADAAALKAMKAPQEGWTVSLDDTNEIYRFDADSNAAADGDGVLVPADKTAGAWIKLGSTVYNNATTQAAGLMSKEDKAKLDGIDPAQYVKYNAEKDIDLTDKQLTFTGGLVKNFPVTTGEGEQAQTTNYLFLGNMVTEGEGEAAQTKEKGLFISGGTVYYGGQTANDEVAKKSDITAGLNGKVDKVNGKGLSSNDFTNEYKAKLDGLNDIQAATNDMIDAAMTAQA